MHMTYLSCLNSYIYTTIFFNISKSKRKNLWILSYLEMISKMMLVLVNKLNFENLFQSKFKCH